MRWKLAWPPSRLLMLPATAQEPPAVVLRRMVLLPVVPEPIAANRLLGLVGSMTTEVYDRVEENPAAAVVLVQVVPPSMVFQTPRLPATLLPLADTVAYTTLALVGSTTMAEMPRR